jgi:hypothetical protein
MSTPDEDVEAVVARGGDADDILRGVVAVLAGRYGWAGIAFAEGGERVLGPQAGGPEPADPVRVPVVWGGEEVAELRISGTPEKDRISLGRAADLVAGHCLVGWDTGGEAWEP